VGTPQQTMTRTPNPGLTLAAMVCVVAMTQIDMTIVSIAAPDIQSDLGLSVTGLQWMVTGYLVSLAALFALGGRLADVVGHRTMVIAGSIVFVSASMACGATPSGSIAEAWLVTARVVQGAGAALMFPAALAVVLAAFPIERRGRAVAIFFAIAGALTSLGPFVGAYLTEWTWRSIFFINVPVFIAGLILTLRARVDNHKVQQRVDWAGALLVVVGVGLSITGFQQAATWGWASPATLACLIGGAVAIGVFVLFERTRDEPLLRLRYFTNRVFAAQNAVLLAASAAFVPVFFFSSLYAQVGLGWSPSNSGLYLLIFFGGFAPAVQVAGRLLDTGRAKLAAVSGGALGTLGFIMWAQRLPGLSENNQWPWILVAGAGLGLIIGASNTDAVNQVPEEHFGEATGITQTVRNYGASLGLAVLGTLFASQLQTDIENASSSLGIEKSQADEIAAALHGSGGDPSEVFNQFGANAGKVFSAAQEGFAEASQYVFWGLAACMAITTVVALIALPWRRPSP